MSWCIPLATMTASAARPHRGRLPRFGPVDSHLGLRLLVPHGHRVIPSRAVDPAIPMKRLSISAAESHREANPKGASRQQRKTFQDSKQLAHQMAKAHSAGRSRGHAR